MWPLSGLDGSCPCGHQAQREPDTRWDAVALEAWASREAASIMVGLFVVAAIVTIVAIPPALALGGAGPATRRARGADGARMLTADGRPDADLVL